jgi:hypothetical protein
VVNLHLKEKVNHLVNLTVIDLEMKIRMKQQSLSAVACEHGFAVSTVNTIVKDAA